MQQFPSLSNIDLDTEVSHAIGRRLEEFGCGDKEIN